MASWQYDPESSMGLLQAVINDCQEKKMFQSRRKQGKQVHIFVLDRSGSMAGSPWTTIKEIVRSIEAEVQSSKTVVEYICYDSTADITSASDVLGSSASGGTNFIAAFNTLQQLVKQLVQDGAVEIITTFMTDGEHGRGRIPLSDGITKLQQFFARLAPAVSSTVHSIGFGSSHSLEVLESIRTLGSREGFYRYTSRATSLDQKFMELFEFAETSFDLEVDVGQGLQTVKAQVSQDNTVQLEAWFSLPAAPTTLVVNSTPPLCLPVQQVEVDALFKVKLLEREMEDIENVDVSSMQQKLNLIDPFKVPRQERQDLLEARSSVQCQLDAVLRLQAADSRSAGAAAELADLRFAAVFSKSRRQRNMDRRVVKNSMAAEESKLKLQNMQVDPASCEGVDMALFHCDVSHMTAMEAMMDGGDIMGLGIRVNERAEHVVDSPTNLQVAQFSVTVLTFRTFQEAVRYQIPIVGQQGVHGEFYTKQKRDEREDVPSALAGRAREAINAWLPLFVCQQHFELVQLQLAPILGLLFTADPLGYKSDQILGLYAILGHMHAHLDAPLLHPPAPLHAKGSASERQMALLEDYRQLCASLLPAARASLGEDLVDAFCSSTAGRVKSKVQNLMTVVGWASARNNSALLHSLRMPLLEEAVRRQLAFNLRVDSDGNQPIWNLIKTVLYGDSAKPSSLTAGTLQAAVREAEAAMSPKVQMRFRDYAHTAAGLSSGRQLAPEWEQCPSSASGEDGYLEVDLWDDRVASTVEAYLYRLDLSYLKRATGMDFDLRAMDRRHQKALLVNSLMFHSNDLANEGSSSGRFQLAADNPSAVLSLAHHTIMKERKLQVAALETKRQAGFHAGLTLYSTDMWAFCGRLMAACPTRGGPTWDAIASMAITPPAPVPMYEEKVKVLILGCYTVPSPDPENGHARLAVVANGSVWRMTAGQRQELEKSLDPAAWRRVEVALAQVAGTMRVHVYRGWPADIPNRHGHCNSNPSKWALSGSYA